LLFFHISVTAGSLVSRNKCFVELFNCHLIIVSRSYCHLRSYCTDVIMSPFHHILTYHTDTVRNGNQYEKYRCHSDQSALLSTNITGYDSATPPTFPPCNKGTRWDEKPSRTRRAPAAGGSSSFVYHPSDGQHAGNGEIVKPLASSCRPHFFSLCINYGRSPAGIEFYSTFII